MQRPPDIFQDIERDQQEGTQSVITCSKLTIKALEQGVKYIQS